MLRPLKLDIQVSHFPVQSARHSVHSPESVEFPLLIVPNTSFDFCG
jgi:hypothetical protein